MSYKRDSVSGLQYLESSQSVDFRPVSIQVADPCLPSEAVNKSYADAIENRLLDLLDDINTGLTIEQANALLQPIKDSVEALKQLTSQIDADELNRIAKLENLVNELIKRIGPVTIVYQGSVTKYFNLGLGSIEYTEAILCNRKIVETKVAINTNLGNANYTPIGVRRVKDGRYVETLPMPCNWSEGGEIVYISFQSSDRFSVGDLQLIVTTDGQNGEVSSSTLSPELIAQIEAEIGQSIQPAM
jgi:hypothetical protein